MSKSLFKGTKLLKSSRALAEVSGMWALTADEDRTFRWAVRIGKGLISEQYDRLSARVQAALADYEKTMREV